MEKPLLLLDVETTGKEEEDRLLQVAFKLGGFELNELFKPPVPIGYGAMSVHHITEEMVADKPAFIHSLAYNTLTILKDTSILVAHNAQFDLKMLAKEGLRFDLFIDTLKVERYLDEEDALEMHKLQYLRYLYGFKVEAAAHDAMGDVKVLELLYHHQVKRLMDRHEIEEPEARQLMMDISTKPLFVRKFRVGKYKGELVRDVFAKDKGYLSWWFSEKIKEETPDEDWLYTLKTLFDGAA